MSPNRDEPSRRPNWPWGTIAVVAFALVVRVGVLAVGPEPLERDPDGYRYLAENLLERGSYAYEHVPTAYRPPLYPLMLAPCVVVGPWSNVLIGALHVALAVATVWLVCRLGVQWGLGRWSLLAGALVACDPVLLVQSRQVMTETPAVLLTVLALWALTAAAERPSSARTILAGACVGLATLCRASFLPFAGLAALALPVFARGGAGRLRLFASFAVGTVAVLAPWAVRNQLRFGRPILATTHGGYTLLLANNPSFYEYLRSGKWGTVWDADAFNRAWEARATRTQPADELRNDRVAYREALSTMRSQPATFLYACVVGVGRLWAPLPHQVDPQEGAPQRRARYLVGAWNGAEFAFALAGLVWLFRGGRRWRSWRATWSWGLLLVVCFTAVHAFYWSNLRMRAPLIPVVALAAAAGTAWIARGLPGRNLLPGKGLRR